jgi:hypothetical protein
MTAFGGLRRDIVILTCAVSAGIHGALAPEHFAESTGAGVGFAIATVLLAAVAVALTRRPGSVRALIGAIAVLGGLIVSYAAAVTSGVPLLHPDPEAVDGLGVVTKAIEAVGVLVASSLIWRRPVVAMSLPLTKGTVT